MTKTITKDEALDIINSEKPEGDIDLVLEVRNMLVSSGLASQLETAYDCNRYITDAVNKNSDIQRFYLNRYWNIQLMSAPEASIEERYCLLPGGDTKAWLEIFQAKVLPFIIKHRLPVAI